MFETKLGVPSKTSEADIWTCLCFLNSRHETPKKETISQKSFNQAITYFFGQCLHPSLVGKVKLVTQDIFLSCVFFAENNMFIDKCFVPRCPKAEAWEYLLFRQKFLNSFLFEFCSKVLRGRRRRPGREGGQQRVLWND